MLTNTRFNALKICLAIAIILLNLVTSATVVWAATAVDVTITALPSGLWAPTGFTATYIDPACVSLSWVANPGTVATLIRAKIGSYPANATDGYIVYNGAGESMNDTAMDYDQMMTDVYYIAWGVDGAGNVSNDYTYDVAESGIMTAFVLLMTEYLPLILQTLLLAIFLFISYWRQDKILYLVTGLALLLFGLGYIATATAFGIAIVVIGLYTGARGLFSKG